MRLLLAGDFACHTGLSRVSEAIAAGLADRGWDISVLAVNYHGDATPLQQRYRLYPAHGGGDAMGAGRIAGMVTHCQPDAILMIHDAWNAVGLLQALYTDLPVERDAPPVVCYVPIDGTGLKADHVEPLNQAASVVAYTQFGRAELRKRGLTVPCHVIPHGVDLDLFQSVDQAEARSLAGLEEDTFAVLVLDRNQPRKRLDIAFDAFSQFAADKPEHVKLVYHGSLKDADRGWDIEAMAADLGFGERLVLTSRQVAPLRGVAHDRMPILYSMCDVRLSTSSGEGWGLPTMEAMACGLPNIVPDFAALGEWARDAAYLIPAPIPVRHCGGINTVGRVPETGVVARALDVLYHNAGLRAELAERGRSLVVDDRYRWDNIASAFDQVLQHALGNSLGDRAQGTGERGPAPVPSPLFPVPSEEVAA